MFGTDPGSDFQERKYTMGVSAERAIRSYSGYRNGQHCLGECCCLLEAEEEQEEEVKFLALLPVSNTRSSEVRKLYQTVNMMS